MRYTQRRRTLSDPEIAALYAELKSSVDVAIRANTSDTTVLRIVREQGGEVLHKRGRCHKTLRLSDAEICRRYLAGETAQTVSGAAGCGISSVYLMLRRNGIPRRPRGPKAQ